MRLHLKDSAVRLLEGLEKKSNSTGVRKVNLALRATPRQDRFKSSTSQSPIAATPFQKALLPRNSIAALPPTDSTASESLAATAAKTALASMSEEEEDQSLAKAFTMSPEQFQYIWRKTIPHIEVGMGSGVFTSHRSARFVLLDFRLMNKKERSARPEGKGKWNDFFDSPPVSFGPKARIPAS
ncbi:hypothetical protein VNO77_49346 [Canavalia gladiata]|uniref:Uncharacterized protein n=1 Tax=Canavalia gladiata TaxID=3824 RepID=A0AAN9PGN4_CANGL